MKSLKKISFLVILGICFSWAVFSLALTASAREQRDASASEEARIIEGGDLTVDLKEMTSFKTRNGGEVRIRLLCDDAIIVSLLEPEKPEQIYLRNQQQFSDLVTLYQAKTGKGMVPADVLRINDILSVNRENYKIHVPVDQNETGIDIPVQDGPVTTANNYTSDPGLFKVNLSESDFMLWACIFEQKLDYHYCWTRRTGNGKYQGWVYYMITNAYVYRGSVHHKIRRKKLGDWSNYCDHLVPEGWYSNITYYASYFRDYLKGEVWEGDGDGYHLAISGEN